MGPPFCLPSSFDLYRSLWPRPPTRHTMSCHISAPLFQEVRHVRVRQIAKIRSGVPAPGVRLLSVDGGRTYPRFAVALSSHGGGMARSRGARSGAKTPEPDSGQSLLTIEITSCRVPSGASMLPRCGSLSTDVCTRGPAAVLLVSSLCITLNRVWWWDQEGVEPFLYDGVAFAGRIFQARPVENYNFSSSIADKAIRLH